MSDRSKTPTLKTLPDAPKAKVGPRVEVGNVPPLATAPPRPAAPPTPPVRDSLDDATTHIFDSGQFPKKPAINDTLMDPEISETYSRIDPSELQPIPAPLPAVSMMPRPPKLPDDGTFKQEVSTPIRAISMKTPGTGDARERADTPPRAIPQVQLRSMADVSKSGPAQSLGYLAPPRDHREVRARRRSELVIWGSICVMLACAVALGIWFLAK